MLTIYSFKNSIGFLTADEYDGRPIVIHLYGKEQCNAAMAGCNFVDNSAVLQFFFCDTEHAKRCLGLAKNSERWSMDVINLHFYANTKECIRWASLFAEAYPQLNIYFGVPFHEEIAKLNKEEG